jgi:hypothetical protein
MLIGALLLGALAAYYFGLRIGVYAAVVAGVLSVVPLFAPRYAIPAYFVLFVGAIAIWQIGKRRKRPTDAVVAVRAAKHAASRLWSKVAGVAGKRDE